VQQRTGVASLARPALRSGLHVVRRDDDHLQIGLDPPDRLVLRDRPGLYTALTTLERVPAGEVAEIVDRLVAQGWIVDASAASRAARTAVERRDPVALIVDASLRDAVARGCATAGVPVDRSASSRRTTLVVALGEPRRRTSDALVRDDVAHLWLSVFPGAVRIGPFVEPGRTACLRCVDAHLGERDARRATVLHQLEELPPALGSGWDPCLVELGVAWALRDVVRRLDGAAPALRSATVTVDADLDVTRQAWLRHPHCGCAWG
jgi:hypothetical protein